MLWRHSRACARDIAHKQLYMLTARWRWVEVWRLSPARLRVGWKVRNELQQQGRLLRKLYTNRHGRAMLWHGEVLVKRPANKTSKAAVACVAKQTAFSAWCRRRNACVSHYYGILSTAAATVCATAESCSSCPTPSRGQATSNRLQQT